MAGYNEKPRRLTHPVALDRNEDGLVPVTPDEAAVFHKPGYVYLNPRNGEQLVLGVSWKERNHFKRKLTQLPDLSYREKYQLWRVANGDGGK